MKYVTHVCGPGYPQMKMHKPTSPRERIYAERRLQRIWTRAQESRGAVMNLNWLHWFGEWCDLHNAICGQEDCSHGQTA